MNQNWTNSRAPLVCLNTTAEEIPPYACMELDYSEEGDLSACILSEDQQDVVWKVKKPTADAESDAARVVFNGPSKILANGRGVFSTEPFTLAAFDNVDGDPEVGGSVGPKAGSWYLTAASSMFPFKSLDSGRAYYVDASQRSIWIQTSGGGGGTSARFFKLLEDFIGNGPAWADWVSRLDDTSRGTMQVVCYSNLLDGALAGYKGVVIKIDGEWVPPVNPCKTECANAAVFTGTPGDGVVGDPYTFTPTVTDVDAASISADGLPPGLTIDDTTGEITGTPTTEGDYGVKITGTSPKTGEGATGDCTFTRYYPITIAPAE